MSSSSTNCTVKMKNRNLTNLSQVQRKAKPNLNKAWTEVVNTWNTIYFDQFGPKHRVYTDQSQSDLNPIGGSLLL